MPAHIVTIPRPNGPYYRVRWRDNGGRPCARGFSDRGDAEAFAGTVRG
jgi:hypothetical protein